MRLGFSKKKKNKDTSKSHNRFSANDKTNNPEHNDDKDGNGNTSGNTEW